MPFLRFLDIHQGKTGRVIVFKPGNVAMKRTPWGQGGSTL